MALSLPAFAHRVTVLGSTRNIDATSAGVSSGSGSCVRDAIGYLLYQVLVAGGGGPSASATHRPASPRCPTWAERMMGSGLSDELHPDYPVCGVEGQLQRSKSWIARQRSTRRS